MICEEMTIGASPDSISTSRVMIARCRWVIETMRVELIRTRLPDGVRHTRLRRSTPSRKSRVRSYCSRSAVPNVSGSSST